MSDSDLNNVFLLGKNNDVCRLDVSLDVLEVMKEDFRKNVSEFSNVEHSIIDFKPTYVPNDYELLKISNFCLSNIIIDSIRNPVVVPVFDIDEFESKEVRSLFMGSISNIGNSENITVAFKRMQRSYVVSNERTKFLDLFLGDDKTFRKCCSAMLSIPKDIQALYSNGDLIFKSYKLTNEMLDLTSYYRVATDQSINEFITDNSNILRMVHNNSSAYSTKIRKLFAIIQDEDVLKGCTIDDVIERGREHNISFTVETDSSDGRRKLVLDSNKKDEFLMSLNFLAQNTFVTTFSKEPQITNSRRKL